MCVKILQILKDILNLANKMLNKLCAFQVCKKVFRVCEGANDWPYSVEA